MEERDDAALRSLVRSLDEPMGEALRSEVARVAGSLGADSAPLLAEGAEVGPWTLGSLLGAGGQAVVYRASDEAGREVALKLPFGDDPQRLGRELRALEELAGRPGIVGLVAAELNAPRPWIALELCPEGSLAERMAAEGPLPADEVRRIGLALLDALETAHARAIVHRDLKPQNVLFDAEDRPLIADFGLGKRCADEVVLSLTRDATRVAGTPLYFAPEQERGGPVDGRTDLYAFGKLLYHMLTGEAPRTLRPVERVREGIDPQWSELVFGLTEPDPAKRPADAAAVRGLLTALGHGARIPEARWLRLQCSAYACGQESVLTWRHHRLCEEHGLAMRRRYGGVALGLAAAALVAFLIALATARSPLSTWMALGTGAALLSLPALVLFWRSRLTALLPAPARPRGFPWRELGLFAALLGSGALAVLLFRAPEWVPLLGFGVITALTVLGLIRLIRRFLGSS